MEGRHAPLGVEAYTERAARRTARWDKEFAADFARLQGVLAIPALQDTQTYLDECAWVRDTAAVVCPCLSCVAEFADR